MTKKLLWAGSRRKLHKPVRFRPKTLCGFSRGRRRVATYRGEWLQEDTWVPGQAARASFLRNTAATRVLG